MKISLNIQNSENHLDTRGPRIGAPSPKMYLIYILKVTREELKYASEVNTMQIRDKFYSREDHCYKFEDLICLDLVAKTIVQKDSNYHEFGRRPSSKRYL